jgi:tRNA pseudouridine38-40 synthase
MAVWKLTIEYDGTKYSGWQEQRNARTVQGELKRAAQDYFGAEVDIQGAGRTDAGVHALAQVASLRVAAGKQPSAAELIRNLNDRLPAEIAILNAERAHSDFHPRHDAIGRVYVYQISTRKTAFAKRHVWWIKDKLDIEAMALAAALIAGRHDFACFRAPDPTKPGESTIVVVESAVIETEGDLIVFRIAASHYLWRMVRRLVGALVKVGKHEIREQDFARLLSGKCDPRLDVAAWTAPASGLFFERVRYRGESL